MAHKQWGKGLIDSFEGDKVLVLFDEIGLKTLSLQAVIDQQLLESA